MSLPLAIGPTTYWYVTRGSGAVALILLSITLVMGVVDVKRYSSPRWPRFVIDSLHRSVSLLALVFLALIITSLLRRHLSRGVWRTTHWLAYACWPLAVMHGLGTGSDSKFTWMLALNAFCIFAVAAAVAVRVFTEAGPPASRTVLRASRVRGAGATPDRPRRAG